jgi:hypothetical protein
MCGNDFDAILGCDQCAMSLRGTDVETKDVTFD